MLKPVASFDLRKDIRFNTRVTEANFDEKANRWTIRTEEGDAIIAEYFIGAAEASKLRHRSVLGPFGKAIGGQNIMGNIDGTIGSPGSCP